MPFYTFKCRTCGKEEDFLRSMGDFKEPLCSICSNNPEVQGDDERMERQIANVQRPKFNCTGFYETDYKIHKDRKDKAAHNYKVRKSQGNEHIDPILTNYEGGQIPLNTKHDKKYGKRKKHKPKKDNL